MNSTIDQWEVFQTVVQLESFAAAAAKMNRSQSTISYAISRLQDQFKIPLFEMKGRRAQLTEAGRTLLADAEPLLNGFRALEEKAASLAAGGETQIKIAADSLYPNELLFNALAKMNVSYPNVRPQIQKVPFLSSSQEFAGSGADLCITAFPAGEHFVKPILDIRIRAVARFDHVLSKETRELNRADLVQHQAVVIGRTTGPESRHQPFLRTQRILPVNTIESAIEAVRRGMCFGWLPVYRIAPYLESGELVNLRLPLDGERLVRMFLVLKDADSTSRAKSLLLDLFAATDAVEVL